MGQVHGKNTVVLLGGTDISTHTNTSSLPRTKDSHDSTTYGKDSHVFSGGLRNATATIGGLYDSDASTGPRAVILPLWESDDNTTLVIRHEGTGSGLPQDSVSVVVTGYTQTSPVAGMVTWEATFQCSDDIDDTAQA
jgi:hypothetical protein